jgi:hypothetical protein
MLAFPFDELGLWLVVSKHEVYRRRPGEASGSGWVVATAHAQHRAVFEAVRAIR